MKNQVKKANIIRWVARIWGSLILAFVLFFILGHLFGDEGLGLENLSNRDIITFICFPVSSVIGLSIALKNEKIGGFITTLGIIGLLIVRSDLITNPYIIIGIVPPGILYLVYWLLSKKLSRPLKKNRK
jgi:hypothetical protein